MTSLIDVQPACGRRPAGRFSSFPRLVWVCEIEVSHMGKKAEIPNWCARKIYHSVVRI